MPIVDMSDMLSHAYRNRYAIGAFDVVSIDFIEGVVAAAEHCRAPIILSLAESHFEHYDFELLLAAVEKAAQRTTVPVAIHLDHGATVDMARRAINLGCNGVMVDATAGGFEENLALTRRIAEMAHACGVTVEGELGYVPGVEGEDAERHPGEIRYTTPEEATEYVRATQVDCLAVSIGTVHGRFQGEAQLDFARLEAINNSLGIPLVIHGGTGLTDAQFRQLIERGVAKINYYTALADAAAATVRARVQNNPSAGYTSQVKDIRQAVSKEAVRCIELWGSSGRAEDLLKACRPWQSVEHVIFYNVEGISEIGVEEMMAEGKRVLGAIPGVREVVCGSAVQTEASYRYAWLVRFTHPAVIDSYRNHPDHRAFADNRFRPVAGNRISIDFARK
jgi:fructose-bisphosphate aldolase class II